MSAQEAGYDAFLDITLAGNVDVAAYQIGPGAARLGAVTIIAEDRRAAISFAQAAMLLDDVAPHLNRRITHREDHTSYASDITAVITLRGAQRLHDFTLHRPGTTSNADGYARFTLGQLRLTVHDRIAATRSSKAMTAAYRIAAATFGPMPSTAQLRQATRQRRSARTTNPPRRPGPDTPAVPSL